MYSKRHLSLISLSTQSTYACCIKLTFFLTLLFSISIHHPSNADNDLKNNIGIADIRHSTPSEALMAQTFLMPNDGKAISKTIQDCNALNKFMDDGAIVGLYEDDNPRMDTITICPDNQWQHVKVEFTKFDLAAKDTLMVFDGNLAAFSANDAPLIGKATGIGVSLAFGGWTVANCSPGINPSGCLTFLFKTNGDVIKSVGWEAWVTCKDREFVITPPSIANPLLACGQTSKIQTIGAATITSSCGSISNDSTYVTIANTSGTVCVETCLSKNHNMSITEEFALGSYVVTYVFKGDETKTATTYFTINEPNLVCNDELLIPMGSACGVRITPDMVLEAPCDPIPGIMHYEITVKDPNGKVMAVGSGKTGDYPILTKDELVQCGNNYEIEVTRVYLDNANLSICNNGRQISTCTSIVQFIDNSPPVFISGVGTDTVFACEPTLTEEGFMFARPKAKDNCSDAVVTFKSAVKLTTGTDCTISTYLVHWSATDNCGNTATLKDTVKVLRPGLDKIIDAPTVTLSCGEDASSTAYNESKSGAPSLVLGIQKEGVFTPTDTVALNTETYTCKYILTKDDKHFSSTCGEKIYRYWTLIDWCGTTGPMPIDTQLIIFKDTIAPVIHCPGSATLETAETIALSHFECSKQVNFPLPTATDNCDLLPEVEMYTVEQYENESWWKLGNNLGQTGALGTGTYRVGYRAYDQCHEQIKEDSCFRYFILEDQTKPSAVCQDQLTVSLSNDYARLLANDIDAGSWDACGIEKILVRRQVCDKPGVWQGPVNYYVKNRVGNALDPTGWSDYVDFECCDTHNKVMVELLVIDIHGNYNYCWMDIIPEDKLDPLCVNLPNQWDYCDNLHNGELGAVTDTDEDKSFDSNEWLPLSGDLADFYNERYGQPYAACTDNLTCQELDIEQQYQLIDLECGVYNVKRRYRVKDWTGNSSNWGEQYISIEYRENWKITLPVDWVGTCGDGVPTAELLIENGYCDLMSYESYDQEFEIVNDACFKVIRTYHIINWCKYKAGDAPISINRLSDATGLVVNNQIINSGQYTNAGYFTYTQILKVADTEAPNVTVADVDDCIVDGNGCIATKTFAASGSDCNTESSENLEFQWEIFENNVPRGTGYNSTFNWAVQPGISYKVKWKVADKCGNNAWVENSYAFKDCYKPTAYCLDGLALQLGSNKEVAIWATDFDVNSADNCTQADRLAFRIWHSSLPVGAPNNVNEVLALPTSISLNCSYVGIQSVHVYIIDEAGNYDFCVTSMNVQDNNNECPATGGMITGRIYTEYGATVQAAEVRIENMDNTMMMTPANGNFSFNLEGSSNYKVVPSKDVDPLNGVSTFDMVKITKHILGTEPFTSPYQFIAADVNASGDVSTFDIIQMRKLILNLTSTFPEETPSWRFIDADYTFSSNEPAAENFPEYIQVNNLNGTVPDLDFIAVKIGDINGSAASNVLEVAESRNTEGALQIAIQDQQVVAGELVEVTFEGTDFTNIEGYQFTLHFDGLEFVEFTDGIATEANIGFSLKDRGYLVTSWNSATGQEQAENTQLFKLTFRANQSGSLLSFIDINSKYIAAEAYRNDGSLLGVALQAKRSAALLGTFDLQQNTPNPFTNSTLVEFELPGSAAIDLQIMDMQGRMLQSQKKQLDKGVHQIEVQANSLSNGTYYYQLVTPFGVAAKKMIVLK